MQFWTVAGRPVPMSPGFATEGSHVNSPDGLWSYRLGGSDTFPVTRKHVSKDASRQAEIKRLRGENGVEMLEFALVIPIFVFVLYGLIAYGVMLNAKQTITNAASEGARGAVGAQPATAQGQKDAAKARAKSAMGAFSQYNVDDPSQFDAQVADCDLAHPGP